MGYYGTGLCQPQKDINKRFRVVCYRNASTPTLTPSNVEARMCRAKLDLIIALDSSGSVTKEGWQLSLRFAEHLVDSFDEKYTRVAILSWATGSNWVTHFTSDRAVLKSKLRAAPFLQQG